MNRRWQNVANLVSGVANLVIGLTEYPGTFFAVAGLVIPWWIPLSLGILLLSALLIHLVVEATEGAA